MLGHIFVSKQKLQIFSNSVWNMGSSQIMAGILSGPNALERFRPLTTYFNYLLVTYKNVLSVVLMLSGVDMAFFGNAILSGNFGALPRRFLKWSVQLSMRFC